MDREKIIAMQRGEIDALKAKLKKQDNLLDNAAKILQGMKEEIEKLEDAKKAATDIGDLKFYGVYCIFKMVLTERVRIVLRKLFKKSA
jgi:hypothetical protein